MPGKKKYKKPVSRQQAKFFGAIAGGQISVPGLSKEEARGKLRGTKMKKLPKEKKMRKKSTVESRLMEREEEKQLMAEEEAKAQKFEELRQALKQQQKIRMEKFGEDQRVKKSNNALKG